ncbi:MAG: hypothetical protein ACUVTP_12420, partial [Candidatus Fervidibacter sp.]|uniref:hypothetical protein n=1 Tax=Candidatus Fervidibacter sp. TaxID=3100871 RepID=UPI00404AD3CE
MQEELTIFKWDINGVTKNVRCRHHPLGLMIKRPLVSGRCNHSALCGILSREEKFKFNNNEKENSK